MYRLRYKEKKKARDFKACVCRRSSGHQVQNSIVYLEHFLSAPRNIHAVTLFQVAVLRITQSRVIGCFQVPFCLIFKVFERRVGVVLDGGSMVVWGTLLDSQVVIAYAEIADSGI